MDIQRGNLFHQVLSLAMAGLLLGAVHADGEKERPALSPLAVVDSVSEKSLAARAGLQPGDRIVGLNDRPNPTLEEVLAYRYEAERARETAVRLRRGEEDISVRLPQGAWECTFRADLAEGARKRLEAAREAVKAETSWAEGLRQWADLADEAAAQGQPEAASWLRLELGTALTGARHGKEAAEILNRLASGASPGSYWAFAATLRLARAWQAARENGPAGEAFRKTVDLARESGPELRLAGALTALCDFESQLGRLPKAVQAAGEALAIRERLVPDSLLTALSLNNLGVLTGNQGDYPAAKAFHLRALAIRERLAPDSLDLAASYNGLGNAVDALGDLAGAREYHRKALAIRERLAPGSPDVAGSLNNLGYLAWRQGDLVSGRGYYLQALAIFERRAPDSLNVAICLNNLGSLSNDLSDLAVAREYHGKALAIRERLAPDSLAVATSLNNLGNVALKQGDLAAAREFYLRSLAIKERLAPNSIAVAASLNNLGVVASRQGDQVLAKECHTRSLAIKCATSPENLEVASSHVNFGKVAFKHGDLPGARESFGKALEMYERLAPGSLDLATSLRDLGVVEARQGDSAAGRQRILDALAIEERLAPGSLNQAESLHALGEEAQARGDLAAAKDCHARAAAIYDRIAPGSAELAQTLGRLGTLTFALGDRPGGVAFMEKALDTLEAQRTRVGGEAAKISFSAANQDSYLGLVDAYLKTGQPERALETLERSRGRALLEMVSSRFIDWRGEIPPALLAKQGELVQLRRDLSDRLAAAGAATPAREIESWREELLMLPAREDALAEEIRQASPRLAALAYPKPLSFQGMVEALGPGDLLIAFVSAEKETFLFLLRKARPGEKDAGLKFFRLPVGRESLEDRVAAFRALLGPTTAVGPASQAWQKAARNLFDLILAPAAGEIAAAEALLVMPDGPLHLLPFGALVPRAPAKAAAPRAGTLRKDVPLGLQRPFSIQLSMTVYAGLKGIGSARASKDEKRWVGFGDPAYPSPEKGEPLRGEAAALARRGISLGPLPGTRTEIENVAALFPGQAGVRLGTEASEAAVRGLPPRTPFLHFACHGLLDPEFPMNSALALSPPAPGEAAAARDDGILQAWEIVQNVKLDADCVVLSACETGVGKVMAGEGVMGLTRAFFHAGARSVMVSLWPISDESTSALMHAFYREVLSGAPEDAALLRAQREVARDRRFAHPFFWAAFELFGRRK